MGSVGPQLLLTQHHEGLCLLLHPFGGGLRPSSTRRSRSRGSPCGPRCGSPCGRSPCGPRCGSPGRRSPRCPRCGSPCRGPPCGCHPVAHAVASYNPGDLAESSPYNYQYAVADDYSGANFAQSEANDGTGAVSGSYSVNLPDGRVQHVTYEANDITGNVATVTYDGTASYPDIVGAAHPVVGHAVAHPALGHAIAHPVAHAVARPVA